MDAVLVNSKKFSKGENEDYKWYSRHCLVLFCRLISLTCGGIKTHKKLRKGIS